MPFEYALVTPRRTTWEEVSQALEDLGQHVTLSLIRNGEFSMITAPNGVPICTLYTSQVLGSPQVDGYGEIPEGMSFWSDLTLHSGSGEYQRDYVQRMVAHLGGALIAPVHPLPPPGLAQKAGEPSGFPARSPDVWMPRVSTLRVAEDDLRRMSYEEAHAVYDFATLPASSIHAEPRSLWGAAGNRSVPDRIRLVSALLDRGAEAGFRSREGTNVLHVLFQVLHHDVAEQVPMIKRLVDEGAHLYDYLFRCDIDILSPSHRRRSPYQSIARIGAHRILLRERCEDHLAAKGLQHEIIVDSTTLDTVGSRGLPEWKLLPRLRTVSGACLNSWISKAANNPDAVHLSDVSLLENELYDERFALNVTPVPAADDPHSAADPKIRTVTLIVSGPVRSVPGVGDDEREELLLRAFQRLSAIVESPGNRPVLVDRTAQSTTWDVGDAGRVVLRKDGETIKVDLHFDRSA